MDPEAPPIWLQRGKPTYWGRSVKCNVASNGLFGAAEWYPPQTKRSARKNGDNEMALELDTPPETSGDQPAPEHKSQGEDQE